MDLDPRAAKDMVELKFFFYNFSVEMQTFRTVEYKKITEQSFTNPKNILGSSLFVGGEIGTSVKVFDIK
jgi:hypothetical protein